MTPALTLYISGNSLGDESFTHAKLTPIRDYVPRNTALVEWLILTATLHTTSPIAFLVDFPNVFDSGKAA